MNKPIDIVIAWVNGNDETWQKKKSEYAESVGYGKGDIHFRDWETLKFLFRGIEKYASWVNRVFLVTDGQVPTWLNVDCPKVKVIDHKDFIPDKYLPTFSSHTIELNFHRIQGLSDCFVYFNDDMFLINKTSAEDFFVNELPVDMAVLYPNFVNDGQSDFDHIMLNDSEFFVRHFDVQKVMKENKKNWYSPSYGKSLLKTLFMKPFPQFPGIMMYHQPSSFLKKSFNALWDYEPEYLDEICKRRFRDAMDLNQYAVRYIQLGKNQFVPKNLFKRGCYVSLGLKEENYDTILSDKKHKLLCLNDDGNQVDFETEKEKLIKAFEKKFPEKSSFEL